ncbi:MAG TPA: S8 family serine peptidase [bacterium]|nr:S8 family serine peptidase [bacterium]
MTLRMCLTAAALLTAATGPLAAQEFYFDQDRTYPVVPSDARIAIQFDTTRPVPQIEAFVAGHPCLQAGQSGTYLARGFHIFELQDGCGYLSAAAEMQADPAVNRALPVYRVVSDSAEFKVTDLIDVQFRDDLSADSGLAILAEFGLHFVDSNEFVHNLWIAALDDSIKEIPLMYGNALHVLPEVEWACASMYAAPVLMSAPSDPYFVNQYYLHNTGQTGGVVDADIDALEAWQFALADSDLVVAVIDDGLISHADLPVSRLLPGRDFAGADGHTTDDDPRPGAIRNHGMACAGILGGSHNGSGIAGVFGSCRIVPVKIFTHGGVGIDTIRIANAIYYAASTGARVISNSWGYITNASFPAVANAIRYATNGCGGGLVDPAYNARAGAVVVFAAGNSHPLPVVFPANMPEVIAVGAIDKSNAIWYYSCRGDSLDLVAPSGDVDLEGDQWTIDQTDVLGWNPYITGIYGNGRDIGVPYDYTSAMGGTSGACPQVAGIAALLMARYVNVPYCNPGPAIREIITRSADDLGAAGWDPTFGFGRANAFRALVATSRGDVNGDAVYDIRDVTMIADVAFRGAPPPALHRSLSDITCDGITSVADVVRIVNIVFRGDEIPSPCYLY